MNETASRRIGRAADLLSSDAAKEGNRGPAQAVSRIPPWAVAIADRLVDGASILRFTGKPFRLPKEVLGAPLEGEAD